MSMRIPSVQVPALLILALAGVAVVLTVVPRPVAAQTGPSIVETQQINDFPREVVFSALVRNGEALSEAVLFYTILPVGAITRAQADIQQGDVTRISASMPTNRNAIFVPVGVDVEWFWELTTEDGTVVKTDLEIYRYEDPRYEWRAIRQGDLTVHYYADEDVARNLLNDAATTLQQMAQLLGIEVPFPIKIYLWDGVADATGVQVVESEAREEFIVTAGRQVNDDLVHIFDPVFWVWRHELTHVLTEIAGEGGIGGLPAWLNEGTATYSEGDWRTGGSRRGPALEFAVERDALLNVRGMASVPGDPGQVVLFYGQSADLVTFLIDGFGPEKFTELFAVFKAGSTVDNALQTVYGFDRDGLDAAYRQSVGLAPRAIGEDRSTQIEDEQIDAPSLDEGRETESPEAEAAPAPSDDEPSDDEEGPTGSGRSEEEIAARRAEIDERLATRRVGPTFGSGSDFPWGEVVTGVGGGALVLTVVLFWMALGRGKTVAAAAGPVTAPPETFARPPLQPPAPASPPSGGGTADAGEERPWSGWRRRDSDAGQRRDPPEA